MFYLENKLKQFIRISPLAILCFGVFLIGWATGLPEDHTYTQAT
jgi:hypothetical protein